MVSTRRQAYPGRPSPSILAGGSEVPDAKVEFYADFDNVVVGRGSSGCSLPARLTDNPKVTLCVIEESSDIITKALANYGAGGLTARPAAIIWPAPPPAP
jgi:hypothetical protein